MPVTNIGLPYPELDDENNPPADFLALATALGPMVNPRFASTAARDTALGAAANGRLATIGNDLYMRRGGTWQIISLLPHAHAGTALLGTAQAAHLTRCITYFTGTSINNGAGPSRWTQANPFSLCLYAVQIESIEPNIDILYQFHRGESSMASLVFWARNRAGTLVTSGGPQVTITLWGA